MRRHLVGGAQDEGAADIVKLVDGAAIGLGEAGGVRHDGGEHFLEVQRRGDGLADLPEGAQLLDGAGKLGGALLELLEQPGVGDGDSRLVGERLDERDLAGGVRDGSVAGHGKRADRLVLVQERDGHGRHGLTNLGVREPGLHSRVGAVREMDRSSFEQRFDEVDAGGQREAVAGRPCPPLGVDRQPSHHLVAFAEEQGGDGAAAELHRTPADRVEDRVEVRGRAGNDPEDLGHRGLLLQGLGDLAVARLKLGVALLKLLEEAGVLDGDDCLVRECLEQRLLLRRKRSGAPHDRP